MSGITAPITGGTTGTVVVAMTGTIGEQIEIPTATALTHDRTTETRSGKEIINGESRDALAGGEDWKHF